MTARLPWRLVPRSLGGQLALLVAVALLAAQAINFALLLRASEQQRFFQTTGPPIAQLIESIRMDALGILATERRRPTLGRTFETDGAPEHSQLVRRADVEARATAAFAEAGLTVIAVTAGEIPAQDIRVQLDPASNTRRTDVLARQILLVSAQIGPDRWLTAVAVIPPADYGVVAWLVFQTLVLYGVVLAPLLWLGRRAAQPLVELRAAADEFRSSAIAAPVAERGPDDIRDLIAAFNGMRTRIAAMLTEKDRMLGAIGHDLRTPLASLRVRAEFVEDEGERERMVRTIVDMNRTLDDILSLARLGRPSEPPTMVDVGAVIDNVVAEFHDFGAPVTLDPAPRLVASMRPNLIGRAVRNLVENAVKYGGAARVRLAGEGDGVAIVVDDDGPGILPDQIERMFEPFTRLEGSRSRETGGVGLGLALARAIADDHGGTLLLSNREGGGLRATMRLPAPSMPAVPGPADRPISA